jgi:hypothetical protein
MAKGADSTPLTFRWAGDRAGDPMSDRDRQQLADALWAHYRGRSILCDFHHVLSEIEDAADRRRAGASRVVTVSPDPNSLSVSAADAARIGSRTQNRHSSSSPTSSWRMVAVWKWAMDTRRRAGRSSACRPRRRA